MKKSTVIFSILFFSMLVIAASPAFAINLTGVWNCDDSGKYYVRQVGDEVFWYGEGSPVDPVWTNVAHGRIVGDNIELYWSDVPKGGIMNNGKLTLKIIHENKLTAIQKTGGFGGSTWTR